MDDVPPDLFIRRDPGSFDVKQEREKGVSLKWVSGVASKKAAGEQLFPQTPVGNFSERRKWSK